MSYSYPDQDDKLTAELIKSDIGNNNWAISEKLALNWAIDYIEKMPRPRRMLDLGCGVGRLFSIFDRHVNEILGLEPDLDRYKEALKASCLNVGSVIVKNGDISVLNDSDKFDIILCSHVIQHLDNQTLDNMIRQIDKHSKLGSILIIATTFCSADHDILTLERWYDGNRRVKQVDKTEFENAFSDPSILPVRLFSRGTIEDRLRGAGYRVEGIRLYHYPNGNPLNDSIRTSCGDKSARDAMYIFRKI